MIAPGTILGHQYRVQGLIGTGGMSHVYKAVNLSNRRTVAIKILKEEYIDDAEFLRRFEREAKAVLNLSHDNIVKAYDVGEAEGLPYIVMEYVEGQTLKQIISQNGPMPARLAVALTTQVLDALGAAHNAGIIHRDVKPQNVIITPSGKAMLADFGIARDVSASTVTFAGSTILGSVHYLSPEQAKGRPVTEGSDLYSAGVMLYEMLTGRVPFDGENSVAIALMHLHNEPTPPSKLNQKVSPALNDVVMRALSKDLSTRYATALEMSRHLRRALAEPTGDFARTYAPEPPPPPTPAKKKKKKKRAHGALKIGVVVAALVAICIGIFLVLRDSYQVESASLEIIPTLTEKPAEEARQKAENYGFVFEVRDYEVSESIAYGSVILQSPEAGTRSKKGATIYVTVSLGPNAPVVPNLLGLTPDEGAAALEQIGLQLGSTQYRTSEVAIGYVCAQSVVAGEEVALGTPVDIWISATSASTFKMPNLVDEVLNLGLAQLNAASFERIYVRYDSTSKAENGTILSQEPTAETDVIAAAAVYLTVSGPPDTFTCSTDVAFNLDIAKNGTKILCLLEETYNGIAYYRILYETALESGTKVPVSFTAYAETEGSRELILTINGEEFKRQEIVFAQKAQS